MFSHPTYLLTYLLSKLAISLSGLKACPYKCDMLKRRRGFDGTEVRAYQHRNKSIVASARPPSPKPQSPTRSDPFDAVSSRLPATQVALLPHRSCIRTVPPRRNRPLSPRRRVHCSNRRRVSSGPLARKAWLPRERCLVATRKIG